MSSAQTLPRLTSELQPYLYQSLAVPAHQIRLLHLLPGKSSDIHITLKTHDFADDAGLQFEALSYTWGSQKDLASVLVDEVDYAILPVTRNLQEALQYLRLTDESRVLWIDAICINQKDVNERSKQLILMAQIYTKATKVVAWLGPKSFDSDLALDCFDTINANVAVTGPWGTCQLLGDDSRWTDNAQSVPFEDNQLWALCNFFHRPWFERLWIWQEIRLGAERATLLCGERSLSWVEFRNASYFIFRKPMVHSPATARLVPRIASTHWLCRERRLDFLSAMDYTRWCKCSDQRDRVFTALTLRNPVGASLGIEANYAKSVQEVYVDAIVKYLKRHANLNFLQFLGSPESMLDLPSWVPDWSAKKVTFRFRGLCSAAMSPSAAYIDMANTLRVKGISVTKIAKVVPFTGHIHPPLQANQVDEKLAELIHRVADRDDLLESSEHLVAVCRVLSQNAFRERIAGGDDTNYPSQAASEAYLRWVLGMSEALLLPPESHMTRRDMCTNCTNRTLFVSDETRYGLAPMAALQGDVVVVLLGCTSNIILRPNFNGTYRVVGDACYDGTMYGEALLGPFPQGFSVVMHHRKAEVFHWAYRNDRTGELLLEDPRLPELPSDWETVSHRHDSFWQKFQHKETKILQNKNIKIHATS